MELLNYKRRKIFKQMIMLYNYLVIILFSYYQNGTILHYNFWLEFE
jgi:hypothetical protein